MNILSASLEDLMFAHWNRRIVEILTSGEVVPKVIMAERMRLRANLPYSTPEFIGEYEPNSVPSIPGLLSSLTQKAAQNEAMRQLFPDKTMRAMMFQGIGGHGGLWF